MKLKQVIFVAVLAIILLIVLFSFQKSENPFPLDKETIEATFERHGLSWTLGEYSSFQEGQSVYMVHNENDKITATLNSIALIDGRMLDLNFIKTSPSESKLTEAIAEDDWPTMFALACGLYGGFRNSEKVFQQMSNYLQTQRYEPQDRTITWDEKIGGIHYMVALCPSLKYYGRFDLVSIKLFDELGYQSYGAALERSNEKPL